MRQETFKLPILICSFMRPPKIGGQAYFSEFVRFINEKEIFNQRACSTKKHPRNRGGQGIFDTSSS
jgi:hypothetical protein